MKGSLGKKRYNKNSKKTGGVRQSVAVFVPGWLDFLFLGFLAYCFSSDLVFLNCTV